MWLIATVVLFLLFYSISISFFHLLWSLKGKRTSGMQCFKVRPCIELAPSQLGSHRWTLLPGKPSVLVFLWGIYLYGTLHGLAGSAYDNQAAGNLKSNFIRVQLKNDNRSCPGTSSQYPAVPARDAKSALLRVYYERDTSHFHDHSDLTCL